MRTHCEPVCFAEKAREIPRLRYVNGGSRAFFVSP